MAQAGQQLLLVEDDDSVAEVIGEHLANAGYTVTREADGRRAMVLLDRQRFALVLLDLMLPGADGWDICRHLRRDSHGLQRHVPIIMLSARSAEAERVLGLELGADDYLPKPFSMLELTARVRALLRRVEQMAQAQGEDTELRLGALCIQPARREARWQGQVLPLTLREFDLLYFFARHPDAIFGRDELLQRVWGAGFDGYEHTVNSHINRLRRKLEHGPGRPRLIETVWGLGYRLDARAAAAACSA